MVFNNLKFTLKLLKCSYMFRSYDHPQGSNFGPYQSYSLKHSVVYFVILIWCCGSMLRFKCFNVNFRLLKTIYVHLLACYLNKLQNARRNDKDSMNLCSLFKATLKSRWWNLCMESEYIKSQMFLFHYFRSNYREIEEGVTITPFSQIWFNDDNDFWIWICNITWTQG